jgi:hypothetical protein
MDFYLERTRDSEFREVIRFRGEIADTDIARLKLDGLDRRLCDDPPSEGPTFAADALLTLEMLFRRSAEQGLIRRSGGKGDGE